jgi:plastocyanin
MGSRIVYETQKANYLHETTLGKRMRVSKIKTRQFIDFTWNALALVAITWLLTFGSASASSVSEREVASAVVQAASAEISANSTTEVKIDNFAFTPALVTVKAGTEVTWINHDDIPHTVDSTQGKFKSAALDTNDKFQFRFTEPGEYPFYCRMHPKMTGKVIVQP